MEIFQNARQFCGSAAVTSAKSLLAFSLAKLLNALQLQLDQYRQQIEALLLGIMVPWVLSSAAHLWRGKQLRPLNKLEGDIPAP